MTVVEALDTAMPAVTHYEVLETHERENYSIVKLAIETGRTHQIRVHMASIGHPLLGDPIYGNGNGGYPYLSRTALHAYELRWEHPHTGKAISVKAEIPEELKKLIQEQ